MRLAEIGPAVSGPNQEEFPLGESWRTETSATQTSATSAQTSAVIDVSTGRGRAHATDALSPLGRSSGSLRNCSFS